MRQRFERRADAAGSTRSLKTPPPRTAAEGSPGRQSACRRQRRRPARSGDGAVDVDFATMVRIGKEPFTQLLRSPRGSCHHGRWDADASDDPASSVSPGRDCHGRVPCSTIANSSGHSAGNHRRRTGTCPRPAKDRARPGVRAASRAATDHLFVGRGDELARISLQSAPNLASRHRMRDVHDARGCGGDPLAVGLRLASGLYFGRHCFAAGPLSTWRSPPRSSAPW